MSDDHIPFVDAGLARVRVVAVEPQIADANFDDPTVAGDGAAETQQRVVRDVDGEVVAIQCDQPS